MSLRIQILGVPSVERADPDIKPRGRKTWAVLAYLLLADDPPTRRGVSELLFSDADDPLGALRWTLADVRRVLGDEARIEGNPLRLVLPPDASVDVEILTRGTWAEAVRLPTLGRDLIEGLDFPFSPGFELWLASERRRLGGHAEAVLREATLSSLADREPAQAPGARVTTRAAQSVRREPSRAARSIHVGPWRP